MKLGANWQTSVIGLITALVCVVATNPSMVDFSFLSEEVQKNIVKAAGLLTALGIGGLGVAAKDKNATGGTVPVTDEAKERVG